MSGPMQAVVSFARYPIGDLQAPAARDVIAAARRQLDTTGLCMLPNFITGDALATMRTEALAALPLAVRHAAPLAQNLDLGITPMRIQSALSYDLFGPQSPLRQLYEWDGLAALCRAILNEPHFYTCEDPHVSCFVTSFANGDELGWHYDTMDTAVTMVLQDSDSGGVFEFARNSREAGPATEREVAAGRNGHVRQVRIPPGALTFFHGRHSLHRVTPVGPGRPRLTLTMCFHGTPGKQFDLAARRVYAGDRATI
ncbi:MAG: 2OG-Fe(II) oxygenase [Alphaproteobacteria bacterium]